MLDNKKFQGNPKTKPPLDFLIKNNSKFSNSDLHPTTEEQFQYQLLP